MSLHRLFMAFETDDAWQVKVIELHGCMDTYDRAPVSFTVRVDGVRSVQISRMSYR